MSESKEYLGPWDEGFCLPEKGNPEIPSTLREKLSKILVEEVKDGYPDYEENREWSVGGKIIFFAAVGGASLISAAVLMKVAQLFNAIN